MRCDVAADGADALLKAVDDPPDLIVSDFRMAGLDGRQLFEKLRGRDGHAEHPVYFCGQPRRHRRKAAAAGGGRGFSAQAVFCRRPGAPGEKSRGPPASGKNAAARRAARRDSGTARGDGRHRADAVARDGAEILPADAAARGEQSANCIFPRGSARTRSSAKLEGDAAVYQVVHWTDGEFEIEFGASSDRTTTTRSTTGLLMEAMRLMDEASNTPLES